MKGHKDLSPDEICAVVDTREQTPLDLSIPAIRGSLSTGDYSVCGLEGRVAIERKSLPDLIGCVGRDRDRFEACIARLKGFETRAIVIEASWPDIYKGDWLGKIKPGQVKAALYSWMEQKISVILAHDRQFAAGIVSGILFSAAKHRWEEVQPFLGGLKLVPRGTVIGSMRETAPPSAPGAASCQNPPGNHSPRVRF